MEGTRFVGQSVTFELFRGVLLMVHANRAVIRDDWVEACSAMASWRMTAALIVPDPGFPGLNAAERRQTNDAWASRERMPPVAVLLTSTVHRMVVSALALFQREPILGFAPDAYARALRHIGAPPSWPALRAELLALAHTLQAPGVRGVLGPAWAELAAAAPR